MSNKKGLKKNAVKFLSTCFFLNADFQRFQYVSDSQEIAQQIETKILGKADFERSYDILKSKFSNRTELMQQPNIVVSSKFFKTDEDLEF